MIGRGGEHASVLIVGGGVQSRRDPEVQAAAYGESRCMGDPDRQAATSWRVRRDNSLPAGRQVGGGRAFLGNHGASDAADLLDLPGAARQLPVAPPGKAERKAQIHDL